MTTPSPATTELEAMDGVMYTLGVADFLVFLAATHHYFLLIYRERKSKQRAPNRGEKTFHITVMIGALVRALFFILQPFFMDGILRVTLTLASVWSHTVSLLLLLAYFMLFVVWMNFFYIIEGQISFGGRLFLFLLFGVISLFIPVYLIFAIIWLLRNYDVNHFDVIVSSAFASVNLLVGLGIIFYAIRLFSRTQLIDLSSTRKTQGYQVSIIVALCTICYATKAILTLLHAMHGGNLDRSGYNFEFSYIVTFLYFFFLETVPLCLMVLLLWLIPEWKVETEVDREEQTSLLDPTEQPIETYE